MQVLLIAENFKRGITAAERVVGKNLTLPILSNVLLVAQRGRLQALATNLEIGVIFNLRAKIEKEGRIAVPARILGSFLASVPDEEKISIEAKDQSLNLAYGENRTTIKGMDAQDFPLIPRPQADYLLEIPAASFGEGIQKTIIATAASETRQELTGIHAELAKDKLVLAATDSFRLAEFSIGLKKENLGKGYDKFAEKNSGLIIPARTLLELARSVADGAGQIRVYVGESQIFFEAGDVLYVSRLIDGKYPEYRQVVPKQFISSAVFHKEDLLRAVKVASIFSDTKSREVRLVFKAGEKKIKVSAQSVEAGENTSEVAADLSLKESAEIAFNSRYLIDGLGSVTTEKVFLGFNDNFGPVVFREVSEEGKTILDFLHIVMPIRS